MTDRECLELLEALDGETDIEKCKKMLNDALGRQIEVDTPLGAIKAVKSPDPERPGIFVMLIDKEGKEASACSMQYAKKDTLETRVWEPNDPDGDPACVLAYVKKGIGWGRAVLGVANGISRH